MSELIRARLILVRHIRQGRLDSISALRNSYVHDGLVEITNIKATKPRKGYVTAFLSELKFAGINYDINYPAKDAQPFWQKMFERGLLPHPVSYYLPKKNLTFSVGSLNYYRSIK